MTSQDIPCAGLAPAPSNTSTEAGRAGDAATFTEFPKPNGEVGFRGNRPADDPCEGKRAERSTGTRAEQRADGLRGISALRKAVA